jgi:hypothetical protein
MKYCVWMALSLAPTIAVAQDGLGLSCLTPEAREALNTRVREILVEYKLPQITERHKEIVKELNTIAPEALKCQPVLENPLMIIDAGYWQCQKIVRYHLSLQDQRDMYARQVHDTQRVVLGLLQQERSRFPSCR